MPAAAVIPAPIAYMKVVAVKKLVVGFRAAQDVVHRNGEYRAWASFLGDPGGGSSRCRFHPIVYFEKIRVFKAGVTRP